MANPHKEVKELVKAAKKQGWRVKRITNGYMLYDPSGHHSETVHMTPSDRRGLRRSLSRVRGYGFKWKGR
jgi:predicted lactoylglutathione lyase